MVFVSPSPTIRIAQPSGLSYTRRGPALRPDYRERVAQLLQEYFVDQEPQTCSTWREASLLSQANGIATSSTDYYETVRLLNYCHAVLLVSPESKLWAYDGEEITTFPLPWTLDLQFIGELVVGLATMYIRVVIAIVLRHLAFFLSHTHKQTHRVN